MFREPRSSLPKYFIDKRIEVKESPLHGLGVFAVEDIPAHTIIESSPVMIFHRNTTGTLKAQTGRRHILSDYVFRWEAGFQAIALGFGSLYNHATKTACASFTTNFEEKNIEFVTHREIKAGEEILIRYLSIADSGRLWFIDDEAPDSSLRRPPDPDLQNPGIMSSWDSFRE